MKFAVSHSLKRAGAGVAIAAALVSASGCGYVYTQPTTLQYAASDGVKGDLDGVELRNIMVISTGKGSDGRLLGTILNKSDHDINVTFAFPSGEKSVRVSQGQQVRLENNDSQVIIPKVTQTPGEALAGTKVSVDSQSTTMTIPVLDGTLKEYAPYVPNAASASSHASPSATATPSVTSPAATPSVTPTAVPTSTATLAPEQTPTAEATVPGTEEYPQDPNQVAPEATAPGYYQGQ